jgi:hypothetical protein
MSRRYSYSLLAELPPYAHFRMADAISQTPRRSTRASITPRSFRSAVAPANIIDEISRAGVPIRRHISRSYRRWLMTAFRATLTTRYRAFSYYLSQRRIGPSYSRLVNIINMLSIVRLTRLCTFAGAACSRYARHTAGMLSPDDLFEASIIARTHFIDAEIFLRE